MRTCGRMALLTPILILPLTTLPCFAWQGTTKTPASTPAASQRTSGTAPKKRTAAKPAAAKPVAPQPAPVTPEMALARGKKSCAAGDFKACFQLFELVKAMPVLVPPAAVPPDSVLIKAANPELAAGTTWSYRVLSVDGALDNKLLEVTLDQQGTDNATFRLRLDGKEEPIQVQHQGAKYFSPRAGKLGKVELVAEKMLPDSCSKDTRWSASGPRRGIIQGGQIVGWVEEGPSRSASGPVLHNVPGGSAPAAVVWEGDTRMIFTPNFAFAPQVLTATPEGARVLFNLVSVKRPGGTEQTATPALDSAVWNKLALWLKENAIPGDFERSTVYSLVAHANQHADMQFVMIGGAQLSKTGDGVCLLWGHNGLVTSHCDAQALNVEPNRSTSFAVP